MRLKHKFLPILMIALSSTIFIFTACEDDEPTNSPPTCTITSPEDGAEFIQGETITIAVNAEDDDNNLKEVRFYVNDIGIGSVSSFPYNFDWDTTEEEPGTFTIKTEAIDEAQEKTSDEINITLESGSTEGTVTDIDGNVYNSVVIGNQEWMVENLKTTTYKNGTSIELVENDTDWKNKTTGAYCWYNNDEVTYANTYGALYNWYTVNTGNLCPDGWHVPTDEEWKTLEVELGMSQAEADNINYRGTNEGSKLAGNAGLWDDGDLKNDSEFGMSGFTALPGGARYTDGPFNNIGNSGYWWSATENDTDNAWRRLLLYNSSNIHRKNLSKVLGYSVRCLRD